MKTAIKYRRRRWITAIIFIGLIVWGFDATTPDQCKVPVKNMSQACVDLLYP